MHLIEIIRLCAIWDKPADDRESIPTIIDLFNERTLIDQLVDEARASHASQIPPDDFSRGDNSQDTAAKKSWWKRDGGAFAVQTEETIRGKLSFASSKATEIQASQQMKAFMNFRDRFIAHNLDIPELNLEDEANVDRPKYGDESLVLYATIDIADALHRGLNQTTFDWKGSQAIARRNAGDLWDCCTFQIQTQESSGA
jgi:hypothetical protein